MWMQSCVSLGCAQRWSERTLQVVKWAVWPVVESPTLPGTEVESILDLPVSCLLEFKDALHQATVGSGLHPATKCYRSGMMYVWGSTQHHIAISGVLVFLKSVIFHDPWKATRCICMEIHERWRHVVLYNNSTVCITDWGVNSAITNNPEVPVLADLSTKNDSWTYERHNRASRI